MVLASSHEKVFSSGANLGGFAGDVPLVYKHFGSERFVGLFKLIGALGKPVICAARGHVLAGALGIALACDLIVASEACHVRHARDQRGGVSVHDHGFDLPQRAAQACHRAAAARRALVGAGRAGGGDRQQGRARGGVRRRRRRVGGEAGRQVAVDHASRQGGDAPPARHAAGRCARLPARAAYARALHRGHRRGRHRVLREARPACGKADDGATTTPAEDP